MHLFREAIAAQEIVPAVAEIKNHTSETFRITDANLYVSTVTLSTQNDNKLLQQLKTGFKRTVKWNKSRSEMSNHTKNNILNYLIDPIITKFNRLFVFFIFSTIIH